MPEKVKRIQDVYAKGEASQIQPRVMPRPEKVNWCRDYHNNNFVTRALRGI
jgi:hypothetical protein